MSKDPPRSMPGGHDAQGRPVLPGYDPFDIAEAEDPYPSWKRVREEAPVFYSPAHDVWWVSRYDDVRQVLGDPDGFSSRRSFQTLPPPAPVAERMIGGVPWQYTVASQDAPEHTRLRRLVQSAFKPRHVAEREGEIRRLANGLIDGFVDRGTADLAAEYAEPIPLIIITSIVGAPASDIPQLRRWTDVFFKLVGSGRSLPEEEFAQLYAELADFMDYCRAFINERRAHPREDLASDLIRARSDDGSESLTDIELVSLIISMFVAGNETSASLIIQATACLIEDREQWDAVQRDRSLIPNVLEEALRFRGPVKGIQRTATRATSLGGVAIPEGAQLYLLLGSTGRDDRVWQDPDRFDARRAELSKHLMFGRGLHFCVGAPLARLEGRVALECLLDRLPRLRFAPGEEVRYRPFFRVHSPDRLVVTWR